MTYTVKINKEATAQTNSFDAMVAFVEAHEDVNYISLDFIQDGEKLNLSFGANNTMADFAEARIIYRMGR